MKRPRATACWDKICIWKKAAALLPALTAFFAGQKRKIIKEIYPKLTQKTGTQAQILLYFKQLLNF